MYHKMLEYKESTNFRNIMVPIAHAYTDQELWELSLYIASLPEHPDAADQSERGEAAEPDDASVDDVEEGGAE
jgi:cytochrome c553